MANKGSLFDRLKNLSNKLEDRFNNYGFYGEDYQVPSRRVKADAQRFRSVQDIAENELASLEHAMHTNRRKNWEERDRYLKDKSDFNKIRKLPIVNYNENPFGNTDAITEIPWGFGER